MNQTETVRAENLKSVLINDLMLGEDEKKLCFIIPSYQRGYRWSDEQVNTLLDDLYEFYDASENQNGSVGKYYCLQPVVVKKLLRQTVISRMGSDYLCDDNTIYYEVVDGQQRLTTIYILLKYLFSNDPDVSLFDIEYERDVSCGFLRKTCLIHLERNNISLLNASRKHTTADEYYLTHAFIIADEWIKNKKAAMKKAAIADYIKRVLVDKTFVIFYELPQDDSIDCYSVFRNINNGKIPLTDAELVKAMLLNKKYFMPNVGDEEIKNKIIRQSQDLYARQWDEIQRALSDKPVWSFITGNHDFKMHTRIDFLFNILVMQSAPEYIQNDRLKLFTYYEKQLAESKDKAEYIGGIFRSLLDLYRTIQDWYEDPQIYNYIGYIMTYDVSRTPGRQLVNRLKLFVSLLDDYQEKSHPEFIESLKLRIKSRLRRYTLQSVNYNDDGKVIEQILMLFNIEELNKINRRFNFVLDDFDTWSVEHIKAQHSRIANEKDQKSYLKNERERIQKAAEQEKSPEEKLLLQNILEEIENALNASTLDQEEFQRIAARVEQEIDHFSSEDTHRIGNLALLGKKDNSTFNNAPFYQKRGRMLVWLNDPQKNIPYSTIRVFLKLYSPQEFSLDYTKWGKSDFDDYYKSLAETLKEFIQEADND